MPVLQSFIKCIGYLRKAIPRMPSNLAATKASPGSDMASAKTWPRTVRPPTCGHECCSRRAARLLPAPRGGTHGHVILREEAGQAAAAVVDGELGAVGAVRVGLTAVVFVVQNCNTRNTR